MSEKKITVTITETELKAIDCILDYAYEDERRDYDEKCEYYSTLPESERQVTSKGHIFESLHALLIWRREVG